MVAKSRRRQLVIAVVTAVSVLSTSGCAALVGAGAAGGAYEYNSKQDLDQLNREYTEGKISKQEYEARKKEIEKGSVVY